MGRQRQIDKTNLGYLDVTYQYKLVKYFIEDNSFFEGIVSIVDPNAFTEPALRNFVGIIKDKYLTNSVVPSYEMIGIIVKSKAKTAVDIEECDALIHKLKFETSYEGNIEVKDIALRFFKQQNMIRVANKILEIAGKGDIDRYEECQALLDDATMAGQEEDFGFSIYDLKDKALSNDYTVSIPTGIIQLDEHVGGGLDKGKLGLLIAPAGFGKTSFTTAIDAYAATHRCDMNNHQGYKVLQIYFEDDDVDITRKHFARITQTEARFMKRLDVANRDELDKLLMSHPDKELIRENLRLKHFRSGTKSASDIEIFIKKLINKGFKPDLITIDYFECVKPEPGGSSTESQWTREGVTMRKFENMAKDLNCAIWIATQGNKDSINSPEVVRMDQAGGSIMKVQVAQFIISIARALDDIDKNKAVISILKNRSGKSGKIFQNVKFNNGTCTISCDEVSEFDDALIWKEEQTKREEISQIRLTQHLAQKCQKPNVMVNNESDEVEGNFIGQVFTTDPNKEFSI
jgi:replicative DNA helicase